VERGHVSDTIAAIATALSESGIGIIRISGKDAIRIADSVFLTKNGRRKLTAAESHKVHYGFLVDRQTDLSGTDCDWKNYVIDEVMACVMKSPNSYTAEDTVEISCHGGVLITKRVLETVLKAGARLARPGEFTKRAFLSGRIDLSKAEAVMDLIRSKNDFALRNSLRQLEGSLSVLIRKLRNEILYEVSFLESALDDPEHVSLDGYPVVLLKKILVFLSQIRKLLDSADHGKLIREGIHAAIVGKPNVGKSSFLNLLLGEERAIVTDIAGTTRDILEEDILFHGISLHLIDTAGIRDTQDKVEKIGVEKARKSAADADLILYIVDRSIPLDENDLDVLDIIGSKKCIVLLNKTDLEPVVTEEAIMKLMEKNRIFPTLVKTSFKENIGLDVFWEALRDLFFQGEFLTDDEICITNLRHKEALADAYESLSMVQKSIEDDMPEDFYTIDLMSAYASLGLIIGEEIGEDLIHTIFSKFCVGK
jgi:tRNA modification GTPase